MDVKIKTSVKAQITIFIIIAVLLVAIVVIFLLFNAKIIPNIFGKSFYNPKSFFRSCFEDKVKEGTELIMAQGGYVSPEFNRDVDGKEIAYLCYMGDYYDNCIVQEPMLIQHL